MRLHVYWIGRGRDGRSRSQEMQVAGNKTRNCWWGLMWPRVVHVQRRQRRAHIVSWCSGTASNSAWPSSSVALQSPSSFFPWRVFLRLSSFRRRHPVRYIFIGNMNFTFPLIVITFSYMLCWWVEVKDRPWWSNYPTSCSWGRWNSHWK